MNRIFNISIVFCLFLGVFAKDNYCDGDYSWLKFNDNCYSFEKERLSFYDAEDLCRSKGARLASIHSESENDFLLQKHKKYGGRRWIGLTIYDNDNNYKWSDDSDVNYMKIAQKTQYVKEKCHIFFLNEGWRPDHCELRNYPLCKRSVNDIAPSPLPPITTVAPEGNCPENWLQFNQRCYKFYGHGESERVQYREAKTACLALGAEYDLVSIHSAEEQAFLVQQLGKFGSSTWIGLTHIESDEIGHISVFGWTDNSRVDYTNWAPGHPKPGTWKYCVRLNYEGLSTGQWLSDYCSIGNYSYICSRSPVPNLPTQPPTSSPCSEGYDGYQNSCYKFHSSPVTWTAAEEVCKKENAHLASITDSFQEAFLYSLVNGRAPSMWNGLKTLENTLILQWSDKQPFYYSKWLTNQPRISSDSSCTSMTSDTMEWSMESCEKKLPFVCKTTTDVPPTVPPAIVGKCSGKETQLFDVGDEYCYHIGAEKNTRLQWGNLHRYCSIRGMEMITVQSDHQTKLLMTYLGRQPYYYWLALIRSFDREFVWVNGSPLNYTNWADKEPTTWFDYDCAGFSSEDSKWAIKDCSSALGSICRIKKVMPA